MIVLDLECEQAHRFEGWFASAQAFEQQHARLMVTCPVCGSHDVQRKLSAPHVARSSAADTAPAAQPDQTRILAKLIDVLRDHGIDSEDVGQHFAEEARKIHYGDAEERAIRGKASLGEALKLLEEGISVLPLPPAKEDLH
ncbi:DUF1178 family protein [Uliginosibacterium sp. 31-16]|uniref:DUF1178 family protein n=1 Tax=Uliginosibacterium sp. 31-16 TaxID=3068315 RepID=UPI00273FBC85|nr:DUF1178 family protein [Uliginosibacterium sp. 31-16]MDP5241355.1 DUF1178 family protein [Uliginosibacterium sp. 31-16]